MLILNRRDGEGVKLTHGIEIVVLHSTQGKVTLGFNAPKGVKIYRDEVVKRTLETGKWEDRKDVRNK